MTTRSSFFSRILRVDAPYTFATISAGHLKPMRVQPPVTCQPGKEYRVEFHPVQGTATITEVES